MAASMGSVLLQMGDQRRVSSSCSFLIHEVQASALGTWGETQDKVKSQQIARDLGTFTQEATSENAREGILKVTGEGLIQAAKTVAEMTAPVTTAVTAILNLLGYVAG